MPAALVGGLALSACATGSPDTATAPAATTGPATTGPPDVPVAADGPGAARPTAADGGAVLVVPDIDLQVAVDEGTGASVLEGGAGHYPGTALPGEPGNVGIAGHRTAFGHVFDRLDELHPGSTALLETSSATHTCTAVAAADSGGANPRVLAPED